MVFAHGKSMEGFFESGLDFSGNYKEKKLMSFFLHICIL